MIKLSKLTLQSEPVIHDVNIVDALVMDEMTNVDWTKVSQDEAVSFGLSLGLYRDQMAAAGGTRIAWKTAVSFMLSVAIMISLLGLMGVAPKDILVTIIFTMLIRCGILWYNMAKAEKQVQGFEDEIRAIAARLAKLHPKA